MKSTSRWYAGRNPMQLAGTAFGLTLRELVKPVAGFRIIVHDSVVVELVNISYDEDTASLSQEMYRNERGSAVFLLAAGEFVKSVRCFTAEQRLSALCFVTNLRKSRWFGQPSQGDRYAATSAAEGQYIHALYGEQRDEGCFNVGVVKWKLTTSHGGPCTNVPATPTTSNSDSEFQSRALDLCAIVVRCDSLVRSISVLSRAEYKRLVAAGWCVLYHDNEHVLELFEGEKITGVECSFREGQVQTLRFHTSNRTTAWFGGSGTEPTTLIRAADDASIVGFEGRQVDEAITELKVIQYSEEKTGSVLGDAKEEEVSSVFAEGTVSEDEELQPSWDLMVELSSK